MKLGEIASAIGATLEGDPEIEILRVAPIDEAGPGDLTFVANDRYVSRLAGHRASAVIVASGLEVPRAAALRASDPYLAFVHALDLFHPPAPHRPGIHPTAVVAASARIGRDAAIGPYAVVGERTVLGDEARLDAHVILYEDVVIGDRFVAHAGAVVRERVQIGNDVVLQVGAVVGGDGFGYVFDPARGKVRGIPQSGTVVLEDEVELGVHAAVDRATIGVTRIRRGAKLDNFVQVAHGCDVGSMAFLASQVGLAGSTTIGDGAQLGGQVGVAGHLRVGAGVKIGAKSGISNDVADGSTVASGIPAFEVGTYRRVIATLRHLPELVRRIRRLERSAGAARPGPGSHDDES